MTNQEIARILSDVGEYLEMRGVPFKPRAYQRAAQSVSDLDREVSEIYFKGGLKALENIPGVGVSIADHIEELIKTGKLKYYEQLKKQAPVDLASLTRVEGLGPQKIKVLYQKLKIKNLADLERAAKAGKIRELESFGEKTEDNILQGIEFVKNSGNRFLLSEASLTAQRIEAKLRQAAGVQRLDIVGSFRRRKETVGDIDILIVSSRPEPVMEAFVKMPGVARVYAHGPTKSMIHLENGFDVDLRVIPKESYGAALNYFTGSKDHNVALRKIAIGKGLKLNEYGLYKKIKNQKSKIKNNEGWIQIAGQTEEELYKTLGMDYIEPELREMMGEIEAALRQAQGKQPGLPNLIKYTDLKGDLQVQSAWTDGAHSIEEMAAAAQKMGLAYIAITDHTKRLAMTHGLDSRRVMQQMKEIDAVNQKFSDKGGSASGGKDLRFKVLKGTECDILKDGTLDLPDEILKQLDVVGVSVHSYFNLSREQQTTRIKKAMSNPHADILFHPTGRLINKRPPYEVDMEEIISHAKKTGTVLEIDAFPDRLDLKDEYIRKCVTAGAKLSIDSDAHATNHFSVLEYGIAQARRGWATKENIINTNPVEQMLKLLK